MGEAGSLYFSIAMFDSFIPHLALKKLETLFENKYEVKLFDLCGLMALHFKYYNIV